MRRYDDVADTLDLVSGPAVVAVEDCAGVLGIELLGT